MKSKVLVHFRSNAIAYLALFVALSGTALAASQLPKNSVGTGQLKARAIPGAKVKRNTLTGKNIKESTLSAVAGATNATNATNAQNAKLATRAANSDLLDGIDSSTFLGNIQTYAGMNFEPRDSTATTKLYGTIGSVSCVGTPVDFTQRVQLPQGAQITRVDYRYIDNEPVQTASLAGGLRLVQHRGSLHGDDRLGRVDRQQRKPAHLERAPAKATFVDNAHYSYQLQWPQRCAARRRRSSARPSATRCRPG